jgi:hypothetical protein
MTNDKKPRPRGRPKATRPKDQQIGLRLDDELGKAAEEYRKRNRLDDSPSAIRHMMRRILELDGLIPKPE